MTTEAAARNPIAPNGRLFDWATRAGRCTDRLTTTPRRLKHGSAGLRHPAQCREADTTNMEHEMTTTETKDTIIQHRAHLRGITLTPDQARTLRLAELTLRSWAGRERGDGNGNVIERDETGIPCHVHYSASGSTRVRIADRETAAWKRVCQVVKEIGIHAYHQTDPRGCALYISPEPMTQTNYSSIGIPCSTA